MSGWLRYAIVGSLFGLSAAVSAQDARPVYRIGGDVKPPVVIFSQDFVVPKLTEDERHHIQAATFSLVVDEAGLPQNIRLVRSSGSPALDDAVLHSMHAYKFKPATLKGKPVAVEMTIDSNVDLF